MVGHEINVLCDLIHGCRGLVYVPGNKPLARSSLRLDWTRISLRGARIGKEVSYGQPPTGTKL